VRRAELHQAYEALTDEITLAHHIRALTGLDEQSARAALAWFGLPAGVAERGVATLSPGERIRAGLTVIAHRRATLLLLDEPPNRLAIASLEVLEASLRDWPGALVVVTHDQRLRGELHLERELAL
jgi:ATPase subunit of ABC transporter with duplicated ATPase domains